MRQYKGVCPLPPVTPRSIRMPGNWAQWQSVQPEYRDDIGDLVQRDFEG